MSTSLMDILSCGLAAVIILLIIAMSTSKAREEDYLRATYYEIRVHYDCKVEDTIAVTGNKIGDFKGYLISVPYDSVLAYIASFDTSLSKNTPPYFDSLVDMRFYGARNYQEQGEASSKTHRIQEIILAITPDERIGKFELVMTLDSRQSFLWQGSTYLLDYKIVNTMKKIPQGYTKVGEFKGRNSFVIEYSTKPKIRLNEEKAGS